jgi:S1-C subfamily serine protease
MLKQTRVSFFPLGVVSVAFGFLCGCAGPPPPPHLPHLPEVAMRHVNGSQPIAFQRVVCDVPPGTAVGKYYAGVYRTPRLTFFQRGGVVPDAAFLSKELNGELRDSGFDVVGPQNTLFVDDTALKARFQLGGTILAYTQNVYDQSAGNCTQSSVEVEWQLFDSFAKKVILKHTTAGQSSLPNPAQGPVAQAMRNSLRSLIADSDLALLVAKTSSDITSPKYTNSLVISTFKPALPLSLPEDMDKVIEGVVVIRAGQLVASGTIISSDGYILTAAHAVSGVNEVAVVLKNGLQLTASVERLDPVEDIALIKVPGSGHHALELNLGLPAASGSDLFAIGAPSGEQLSFSVTKGVVSGYREIAGARLIQTDASLNPGNSGGPFLDKSGKVIGICSWKIVRPGFEGLSFGVPVDAVAKELGIVFSKQPQ